MLPFVPIPCKIGSKKTYLCISLMDSEVIELHAKLLLHFDSDDNLALHSMVHIGGFAFTDPMGEHRVSWTPKSKIEIIRTLRKIAEILEQSLNSDAHTCEEE